MKMLRKISESLARIFQLPSCCLHDHRAGAPDTSSNRPVLKILRAVPCPPVWQQCLHMLSKGKQGNTVSQKEARLLYSFIHNQHYGEVSLGSSLVKGSLQLGDKEGNECRQ